MRHLALVVLLLVAALVAGSKVEYQSLLRTPSAASVQRPSNGINLQHANVPNYQCNSQCPAETYCGPSSCFCNSCGGQAGDVYCESCPGCPAGRTSPRGSYDSSQCVGCSVGQYLSGGCQSCPAGKAQPVSGLTSCNTCSAGTYSSSGAASCASCSAGKYSGSNSASCTNCPAGQVDTRPRRLGKQKHENIYSLTLLLNHTHLFTHPPPQTPLNEMQYLTVPRRVRPRKLQ